MQPPERPSKVVPDVVPTRDLHPAPPPLTADDDFRAQVFVWAGQAGQRKGFVFFQIAGACWGLVADDDFRAQVFVGAGISGAPFFFFREQR